MVGRAARRDNPSLGAAPVGVPCATRPSGPVAQTRAFGPQTCVPGVPPLRPRCSAAPEGGCDTASRKRRGGSSHKRPGRGNPCRSPAPLPAPALRGTESGALLRLPRRAGTGDRVREAGSGVCEGSGELRGTGREAPPGNEATPGPTPCNMRRTISQRSLAQDANREATRARFAATSSPSSPIRSSALPCAEWKRVPSDVPRAFDSKSRRC